MATLYFFLTSSVYFALRFGYISERYFTFSSTLVQATTTVVSVVYTVSMKISLFFNSTLIGTSKIVSIAAVKPEALTSVSNRPLEAYIFTFRPLLYFCAGIAKYTFLPSAPIVCPWQSIVSEEVASAALKAALIVEVAIVAVLPHNFSPFLPSTTIFCISTAALPLGNESVNLTTENGLFISKDSVSLSHSPTSNGRLNLPSKLGFCADTFAFILREPALPPETSAVAGWKYGYTA